MGKSIRERIDELKEKNGFKTDSEVIGAIFRFKKAHGQVGRTKEHEYVEKNKGSFSQCCSGQRDFKPEDYLAIEYVLNSSMAYIIEGKGEVSKDFQPKGIRYAAFLDNIGNYEALMCDHILNESDEYNKMLIDYMVEYNSKNGFIYFAERDLLPLTSTGGINYKTNHLLYSGDRKELLRLLCDVLPLHLLIRYFDGFLDYYEIVHSEINENRNTSFTEGVISKAIYRDDLRREFTKTKKISLDSYNRGVIRTDGKSLGEGLFANYGLTSMLNYALNHDVEDEIRIELLKSSLLVNSESFKTASTFTEEELKIDKYGFITNKYNQIYYGSIVIPPETSVELSDKVKELLNCINMQVREYHGYISNRGKLSVFANEILADKKDNPEYYKFFRLMNEKRIDIIPDFQENASKDKDLFKVSNSDKCRISNGTDSDLLEIIRAIRMLDDICIEELNGHTYYMVDPSIYMFNGQVNYIMPKDVVISHKYSNLVRFINDNARWSLYEIRNETKIKRFIWLIKQYGISKNEINNFLDSFISISQEQVKRIDKTNDDGKELAFKTLENKDWIDVYRENIIKEF